ncbi:DUF3107 domain-containing protein [Auraticoccus monumenti]|uniref:ATP-binding protein n=1 Tax=Auraticoccus monumenti TaxID=675864 RepID=A0A1G7AKP9_9ACTN|nr:DUF3107 domain-containing protein [Auraticoccus monumenti]SDE14456.1 Protein of unknown function [Auraticoccus monumenti]
MEIKVGIQHIGREVTVESEATADDVRAELEKAVADDGLLTLRDARGRTVLVPASKIAYLEVGEETTRRVGFGAG